jgi:hypothetical protein
MKFRKKPVVIEATQWFKDGDHHAVMNYESTDPDKKRFGWVNTLEGGHIVTPGDWIITGVKGEHYPCKPDIFAATYEPAEDDNDFELGKACDLSGEGTCEACQ